MPSPAVALARLVPQAPIPDAQLLRAFVSARGEDAFGELVRRHGPMVLAVCRRVLGNAADAEDAFQAVFLVLARKAGSVRGRNVAGWLYGVAVRTARGVRLMRDRRRKRELASGGRQTPDAARTADHETAAVIDEELAKLPELHREVLVLCELRGLSRREAAAALGVPEGTVSSRLAAAKRKLAARLSARGVTPAVTLAAALAPAGVSAALVQSTTAATRGAAGGVASAAASAVVKAMLFEQLRATALVGAVCLALVCGGLAMTGAATSPTAPAADEKAVAPAPRAADDVVAKLVTRLGSQDFAEREAAQRALRALGPKVEPGLRAGLRSEDPEVRARCAAALAEVRKDALAALMKGFDPKAEGPPEHPIWARYKAVAGDTPASRELFARVLKRPEWVARLDAAEAGPEAARQYREAILDVGRRFRFNMSVFFHIPVWPCDPAEEAVYLLFLGGYSGTEAAPPKDAAEAQLFAHGEGRVHYAQGLSLGLLGKEIAPGLQKRYDATAALPAGGERVFWRLLGAWLPRRADAGVLYNSFDLAVRCRAADVLPAARAIAGDEKRSAGERCGALRAVTQFGAASDLPLFAKLYGDGTQVILPPPPVGYDPGPRSRRLVASDHAVALALLLCDRDPAEFGFPHTKDKFARENGRPVIANYEAEAFGFPDDKARAAAHTKAKEWLAGRKK